MRLSGRRIVITGASSGIGLAATRLFAREGADLALLARGRRGLERAADMARLEGAVAYPIPVDVGDREAVAAAIAEAAERLGGIDVLVPNAAAAGFGPFAEIAPRDFDRTLAVAFTGAVDTIRAALPYLRDSRGAIVVTGSIVAKVPTPLFSPYVAAKGALRAFLGALRAELDHDDSGVDVSMVHPGVVDTPFWRNATSATGMQPRIPPGAYGPEPIARAIVDCAVRPRAEVTVGGVAAAEVLLFAVARPLVDRVLSLGIGWLERGAGPAPAPGSLWASASAEVGAQAEERRGRRSLLTPLRLGARAPWRLAQRGVGK